MPNQSFDAIRLASSSVFTIRNVACGSGATGDVIAPDGAITRSSGYVSPDWTTCAPADQDDGDMPCLLGGGTHALDCGAHDAYVVNAGTRADMRRKTHALAARFDPMVRSVSMAGRRDSENSSDRTAPVATVVAVSVGGLRGLIIELPVDPAGLPACLTEAERDVVTLVLEGRSNQEIADARGARYRTVANQLAAIYKKLGIASRTELIATLSGADASFD